MNFILAIFFCLLFLAGLVLLLGSIGQYTSYVETSGEIIEALKCNPYDEGNLAIGSRDSSEEAVVIAYLVEGKTYHLATNLKKPAGGTTNLKTVKVLYNPYFPGESCIKEGTPFLGSVLVGFSIIGFILIVLF